MARVTILIVDDDAGSFTIGRESLPREPRQSGGLTPTLAQQMGREVEDFLRQRRAVLDAGQTLCTACGNAICTCTIPDGIP